MKVFLHSIGCRLNQSEIETMARQLMAAGHEIVSDPAAAEKVVINTCAVTRQAAKDGRAAARNVHRRNATAEIFLTGCYATIAPDELGDLSGVGHVVANQEKGRLVQLLDPAVVTELPLYDREPVLREILSSRTSNTRAFIKVQDGCDNRCTFCVTTLARGPGRSRHLGDIIAEIQGLAQAGYQEAVLTGVHLGSYGQDFGSGTGLRDLVAAILRHSDIPRLRLSSLEPWDVAPGFFELWEDSRLLPHLHLPLQAGSDRILRRMARRTTRAAFRELASEARRCIPSLNLSTDLIAGFPGETEADFQESLEYVAEIGFSRLHVFPFSRRPGTAAATMDDQLPKAIRKERTRRLIDLGKRLSLEFHCRNEGRTADVLWESTVGAEERERQWVGYTDNYIRVTAFAPVDLFNTVTPTRLSAARPEGMSGRLLAAEQR
jgi:threonylcarbamoyladenosine tRNA methylthiotransferase MtaB